MGIVVTVVVTTNKQLQMFLSSILPRHLGLSSLPHLHDAARTTGTSLFIKFYIYFTSIYLQRDYVCRISTATTTMNDHHLLPWYDQSWDKTIKVCLLFSHFCQPLMLNRTGTFLDHHITSKMANAHCFLFYDITRQQWLCCGYRRSESGKNREGCTLATAIPSSIDAWSAVARHLSFIQTFVQYHL